MQRPAKPRTPVRFRPRPPLRTTTWAPSGAFFFGRRRPDFPKPPALTFDSALKRNVACRASRQTRGAAQATRRPGERTGTVACAAAWRGILTKLNRPRAVRPSAIGHVDIAVRQSQLLRLAGAMLSPGVYRRTAHGYFKYRFLCQIQIEQRSALFWIRNLRARTPVRDGGNHE